MAADGTDPLRRLIDVTVYAPIGLLLLAQKEFPGLVEAGRTRVDNQVTLARFIGKVAIKRGRLELTRRLDTAEAARRRRSAPIIDADSTETETETTKTETNDATGAGSVTVTPDLEAVQDQQSAPVDSGDLPIEGYDSLAASQVVVRLATLTAPELDAIRAHEESHRCRRTILGKISQLQGR